MLNIDVVIVCCPFETGLVKMSIIPNGGDRREREKLFLTRHFSVY